MSYLEKSILSTIVYYNNLGQPLTGFEIYKYLIKPNPNNDLQALLNQGYTFLQVLACLQQNKELKNYIGSKNGFYFLTGKEHLIHQRIVKNRIAVRKWKKVKKIVKILQILPFIKMVAVSGSLAVNNTRKKSDIDLLVATKYRRIWLTRVFLTVFIHLLGTRRHKKKTANRFCLNHYITDHSLNIPFKSLYNAESYARLVLVYQPQEENIYDQFQQSNIWIRNYLFNFKKHKMNLHTIKDSGFLAAVRKSLELVFGGVLGNILEYIFKAYQKYRIKKDPLTTKIGGRVTFDDNQLEFHPDSPELKIIQSFNEKTFDLELLEFTNQNDSGLTR